MLLEALDTELAGVFELCRQSAVAALFDEQRKNDAIAAMGVHTWLDSLRLMVSKF